MPVIPSSSQGSGIRGEGRSLRIFRTVVGGGRGSQSMNVLANEIPPGHEIPPHRHDAEEVVVIVSGRGYAVVDGQRVEVFPEDAVVAPPGSLHSIHNAADYVMRVIGVFAVPNPSLEYESPLLP